MSRIAVAMCSAGVALFLIGVLAAKNEIAQSRGLDKAVALTNLWVAVPLAVFGALHLFAPQFVISIVPDYMRSSEARNAAWFLGLELRSTVSITVNFSES